MKYLVLSLLLLSSACASTAQEEAIAGAKSICDGLGIRHDSNCLVRMYQQQMDASNFLDSGSDQTPHRRVY